MVKNQEIIYDKTASVYERGFYLDIIHINSECVSVRSSVCLFLYASFGRRICTIIFGGGREIQGSVS